MELDASKVRLTELASCGGCAAKYSAARLEELLRGFVPVESEDLLVGLAPADDGTVHPSGVWQKNAAKPGDALFLTKPLGTGLIMTGYKRGLAGSMQLERAVRWMKTMNRAAAEALRPLAPNAVTDVTGFGLF